MLFLLRLKAVLKGLILPPAGPILVAALGLLLLKRRPLLARTLLILGLGSAPSRRNTQVPPLNPCCWND